MSEETPTVKNDLLIDNLKKHVKDLTEVIKDKDAQIEWYKQSTNFENILK